MNIVYATDNNFVDVLRKSRGICRQLAGPTAAPNGLYLKEIRYEE